MLHMETAFLDDQLSRVEMEVKYTSIDAQVEVLARTYDLTSLGRDQANILKRMVLLISQHLNVLVSQYRGELDEVERTDERSDAANIVRRLLQDLNELAEGLSSVEPGQSE
jgi:hypothetical protein